ncbi:MAG TPA: GFA family protein [Steroidobacteraceae bacterium]|nr:GFA family protein [Steroidobacteraceae bacterium]
MSQVSGLRGRCLCGAVEYQSVGPARGMWYCHCSTCAKSSGVGFGTWIEVSGVTWTVGEIHRARVTHLANPGRSFCGICGSQLPVELDGGSGALLPAGGLETVQGLKPAWHAFPAERMPWLPAFTDIDCQPRSRSATASTPASCRAPSTPFTEAGPLVKGSCLCGSIAFEASPPLYAMRVCHCSRCRRRSGSSYFVGLACSAEGLSIRRGESLASTWHLPGSARYVLRFCSQCGSSVPVTIGNMAFIAAGVLDADPGIRTRCHIYFASRANWVGPEDSLPHFDELPPLDFNWRADP